MDVSISLQDLFRPASLVLLGLATILAVIVHRRYFSPLRDIPGPFLASFSRLWHLGQVLGGDQRTRLYELHKKHGPFVRIAHDEVSVSHPDAPKLLLLTPLEKVCEAYSLWKRSEVYRVASKYHCSTDLTVPLVHSCRALFTKSVLRQITAISPHSRSEIPRGRSSTPKTSSPLTVFRMSFKMKLTSMQRGLNSSTGWTRSHETNSRWN